MILYHKTTGSKTLKKNEICSVVKIRSIYSLISRTYLLSLLGAHLDLSVFSSSEELMSLGLDRLKTALQALNLKCGGTLEERAKRLFYTKGMSLESLQSSAFAKGKGKGKGVDNARKQKEIAAIESQVTDLIFSTDQRHKQIVSFM